MIVKLTMMAHVHDMISRWLISFPFRFMQISNNRDMLEKLYPCSVCHKSVWMDYVMTELSLNFCIPLSTNRVFDKVKSRSAHMKTHKMNSNTSAVTTIRTASPVNKHHNKSIHHMNKSPAAVMAATPSPLSTTSHSSLSSTSCSLPSPFLPSQSLFWMPLPTNQQHWTKKSTTWR